MYVVPTVGLMISITCTLATLKELVEKYDLSPDEHVTTSLLTRMRLSGEDADAG